MIPLYDIFFGQSRETALWVEAVEGIIPAYERMLHIAAQKPGSYFVCCQTSHQAVASTDTTSESPEKRPQAA